MIALLRCYLREGLLPLAVAAILAFAFSLSYLQPLPGVPDGLRMATHATLVPLLGVMLLRRRFPEVHISAAHIPLALVGLVCTAVLVLIGASLGFEQTYSDWRNAVLVAGWTLVPLVVALKLRAPALTGARVSGWWQVAAALLAVAIWPSGPTGDISVLGELVTNFLLIGMTEELAFRGVIQGHLLSRWRGSWLGISWANWVTALLFAWIHNPTFAVNHLAWFIYLVPMGLFYGVLRERTGSWFLPGVVHGLVAPALYAWALLGVIRLPLT